MSVEEKVALVNGVREEYGLSIPLEVLGLPRSTWYYNRNRESYEERYKHLLPLLEEIARKHPEYGYRRTTTELQDSYGIEVNHKVVQRLQRLWDLSMLRGTKRPRPSEIRQIILRAGTLCNLVAQLDEIDLLDVLYTDFTQLIYTGGMAWLMPIIDHASKACLGWALGPTTDSDLALLAWEKAIETLCGLGQSAAGIIVHHDRDPVYTGLKWTSRLLLDDEARLSYALGGAGDNPEMESFNGRFKTENRSLFLDASSLAELEEIVAERISYYNWERRHSTLKNQAPMEYLKGLIGNG
jgi:transposase InsO family protein